MEVLDWLLVAIRWAHALGAVAWVGGGMFYLLVLRPAFRRAPVGGEVHQAIGAEFRGLVNTAIVVLIVTGIILGASQLTAPNVPTAYVAVLALKVAIAIYTFALALLLRRRRAGPPEEMGRLARLKRELTGPTAILVAGVIVIGLAGLLPELYRAGG